MLRTKKNEITKNDWRILSSRMDVKGLRFNTWANDESGKVIELVNGTRPIQEKPSNFVTEMKTQLRK